MKSLDHDHVADPENAPEIAHGPLRLTPLGPHANLQSSRRSGGNGLATSSTSFGGNTRLVAANTARVVCSACSTLVPVTKQMRDRNIGFIPVCDEAGRAVGVVTGAVTVAADLNAVAHAKLKTSELATLEHCTGAQSRRFRAGEPLIRSGESVCRFFVVRSGEVAIIDETSDPPRTIGALGLTDLARATRATCPEPSISSRRHAFRSCLSIWRASGAFGSSWRRSA